MSARPGSAGGANAGSGAMAAAGDDGSTPQEHAQSGRQLRSILEAEVNRARAGSSAVGLIQEDDPEKHLDKLRDLHGSIVSNIDHVQEQTARILQEQERDLLRAFRARLYDLQMELEKEKARAEDGATVWIEKNRMLAKELDWAKEMADRLDRHNQGLVQENARLKNQYRTQEEDREYLIKQLVVSKKDNARLRTDVNALREELAALSAELEEQKIRAAMEATANAAANAAGTDGKTPSTASGEGGRPKTVDLAAAGGLPAAFFHSKQDDAAAAAQAEAFAEQVEMEVHHQQQQEQQQQMQMQRQRLSSTSSSRVASAVAPTQQQMQLQQQQQQAAAAAAAAASQPGSAVSPEAAAAIASQAVASMSEQHSAEIGRYRDAVLRLKRVLDNERRSNRALRMQLTHELGQRTEAEMFLRRSIEHAKREVDRKRQALMLATVGKGPGFKRLATDGTISPRPGAAMSAAPAGTTATSAVNNVNSGRRSSKDDGGSGGGGAGASGDDTSGPIAAGAGPQQPVDSALVDAYTALPQEDRDQILASLLAQEHVLNALQRITFPQRGSGGMTPAQSLPNSRRGSSSIAMMQQQQMQQHGSGAAGGHGNSNNHHGINDHEGEGEGESEYLEVEPVDEGAEAEEDNGGARGDIDIGPDGPGAGPTNSLGSLPPAASVNFHDHGSTQSHGSGSAAGDQQGQGQGGGFVAGFAAADSISLHEGGGGQGVVPHGHHANMQAPMPVLSNNVPGGNGLTPRDVLQAAKEYTKEVQDSARGRVEAVYGKDFDAALTKRANAHYHKGGAAASASGSPGRRANPHSHSPTSAHGHQQLNPQQQLQQQIDMGAFAGPEQIQGRKPPVMHNPPVSPIPLKTFSKPTIGKAKVAGLKTPGDRLGVAASPNPHHHGSLGPSGSITGGHASDGGGTASSSDWEASQRPASFREAFSALQDKFPTVSQAVTKKLGVSTTAAGLSSSSSSSSASSGLGVSGAGAASGAAPAVTIAGGTSKLSSLGKAAAASLASK